jgi:aspartate aminotransferase
MNRERDHEFEFADRVGRIEPSATIAVKNRAAALEAEGEDVIDLSVGEPDFPTPEPIVEAGKAALDAGHTGYTPSRGIRALREAIAEKLDRDGLAYGADDVIVTPGGKQALFETVQALIDEGDEVVLLDPAWVSYEAMVELAGGAVVRVDTGEAFGLRAALEDLKRVVTDATDLIVVNSPNNPTGAVYDDDALAAVRDLAVDHDVLAVSDEIYDRVTYDAEPTSLGSLDGMANRTVTINGFSKAYSMTGWRLGYLAAPPALVEQAGKLQSHSVTCAANFVQHAGVTAMESSAVDREVEEMVAAFRERRDRLVEALADGGVDVPTPEGAFYLPIPVAEDDEDWCLRALDEAGVATVPGSAFGTPGYARISYAADVDRLLAAVDRLFEAGLL